MRRIACSRAILRRTACLVRTLATAVLVFGIALPAAALAQGGPNFNHSATLFPLEGAHVRVPCENCHKPGLPTKGLPRTCNACHVGGAMRATTYQPPTHIPTPPTQACSDCHSQISWSPARMRHTSEMFGQCSRCHNNSQAPGKPPSHLPTTASCDACHTTGAWRPTKAVVHDATTVGRCSTCHNGTIASGKPPLHVPTTAQCDSCHTSTVTWANALYTHDPSSWGRCSNCHNYNTARGKGANHIPTNSQCDTCHTSEITFTAVTMNHTGLNGQCSACHSGAYLAQNAQTKPATHVATTAQCDSCHRSTTSWATVSYTHDATAVGRCSSCHTPGGSGLAKPSTHIPTSLQCDTCHTNYVAFKPASMNHVGTTGQCASCHNGAYTFANALARSATHIPTTRSCDACHLNFVAFNPATMDHTGLNGQCATCHSGAYLSENAQMKPATHVVTTAQCDTCHASTTTWATATFAHDATAFGNCSNCHRPGGTGLAKPTNHVPTAQQCDTCHTNFIAFKPAFMNHTGTVAQCSTCHNGSYVFAGADPQGATHIPDTRQCDTCHTSTTVWTLRNFVHPANAAGQCANCHSGQYLTENAQMKPATHVATTAQCDTCHRSMTTWATATYTHDATAVGRCSTCHVAGGSGLSKPSTHIPTGLQCDTCHTNYVAFKPAQMNHTGTAGQCLSCHSGAYASTNAQPQGTTHVPTTAQCDSCHTSTTGWSARTMNHTVVAATPCTTCHGGAYLTENAQAKSASHIPVGTLQCSSCHNTTAFSPATMNHGAVTATPCSTCHGGAYVAANAQTKPATHLPTTAECNSSGCHSSTTSWAGAAPVHTLPAFANCISCHVPGGSGLSKPSNHIPTIPPTKQCSDCHNMYPQTFNPIRTMDHTGTTGMCSTCHNATYAFANANPQGVRHIPTGSQCDSCHTSTLNWTSRSMNHSAVSSTPCSTCHSGAYLSENADQKGSSHIATTLECNSCHTSTVNWTQRTMNHTGLNGQCTTCHSGAYLSENAQMKSASHIPTSAQCDACHTSTTVWTQVQHITTGIAGQCQICHNGAYTAAGADAKPVNHIPYDAQLLAGASMSCDACHLGTAAWTSERMNHNSSLGNGSGWCKACHQSGTSYLGSMQKMSLTHQRTTGVTDCSQSGCHRPLGTTGSTYTRWTN